MPCRSIRPRRARAYPRPSTLALGSPPLKPPSSCPWTNPWHTCPRPSCSSPRCSPCKRPRSPWTAPASASGCRRQKSRPCLGKIAFGEGFRGCSDLTATPLHDYQPLATGSRGSGKVETVNSRRKVASKDAVCDGWSRLRQEEVTPGGVKAEF
jgi:hypothetical protein